MKLAYSIETLVKEVRKEAKKLKTYADPGELENLNFSDLNANSTKHCIYGQMAGDCFSLRANQLISQCAQRVFIKPAHFYSFNFRNLELNGKPELISNLDERRESYRSPIEVFISINKNIGVEANSLKLIDYLKGKSKTLRFDMKPYVGTFEYLLNKK